MGKWPALYRIHLISPVYSAEAFRFQKRMLWFECFDESVHMFSLLDETHPAESGL